MAASQHTKKSSINILPCELLVEILQRCPAHPPTLNVFTSLRNKHHDPAAYSPVQTAIASVCREWRQISIACKSLWCVLSINVKPKGTAEIVKHVRLWLERSGDCPLFIRVGYMQYFHGDNGQLDGVLEVLREVSARWKVLDLHVPVKHLSRLQHQNPPMLEALGIFPVETYRDPTLPSFFHSTSTNFDLGSTPLLKRFECADLRLTDHWHSVRLSVNYAQLTGVSVTRGMLVADCLELLHIAPNLVSANIRPEIPEGRTESIPNTVGHVKHSKLQALYFYHHLPIFWNHTTLPSLETLCLDLSVHESKSGFDFQSLIHFARRTTPCKIKRLRIIDTHSYDEPMFLELLAEVPSVEQLVLQSKCSRDSVMPVVHDIHRRRSEPADERPFLPCLRNLTVHYGGLNPGKYGWTPT